MRHRPEYVPERLLLPTNAERKSDMLHHGNYKYARWMKYYASVFYFSVCADNQIAVDGVCLNKVRLGEMCIKPEQCPEAGTCEEGKCICQTGFEELQGKCVKGTRG